MEIAFYEKLQSDFIIIRSLHAEGSYDQEILDATLLSIKTAKKMIGKHSAPNEKKVLLYCINTLFEIIRENDREKIYAFADAIHNIPEIYMQKRNLYSFRKELKLFRRRYGKTYFPFIDEVTPHFSKKAPKNKRSFFSASSDEDFKKLHPVGYKILVAVGITALMIPQVIYIICCFFVMPAKETSTVVDFIIIMFGYVGTFAVGVGLFNIVAAWIHQYLGHLLTIVCLAGGSAVALLTMYLLSI